MTTNRLLVLQSLGIFLQMVNAQLSVTIHDPLVILVFGGIVGAFQFYIQHIGNEICPPIQTPPKP